MSTRQDQAQSTDKFLRNFCIATAKKKELIIESAARILDGIPEDSLCYSASQVARLCSCSRQSVWRLQKLGKLTPVKIMGLRRFRRSDVLKLIEQEGQ